MTTQRKRRHTRTVYNQRITIRVEDSMLARLNSLVGSDSMRRSAFIRSALDRALKEAGR